MSGRDGGGLSVPDALLVLQMMVDFVDYARPQALGAVQKLINKLDIMRQVGMDEFSSVKRGGQEWCWPEIPTRLSVKGTST